MPDPQLPESVIAAEFAAVRRDIEQLDRRMIEGLSHNREIQSLSTSASDKAVSAALASAALAVNKSEESVTKRLEAGNEVRAQLDRQATIMITRAELDVRDLAFQSKLDGLTDRITVLDKRTAEFAAITTGKSTGISAAWGVLIGAVGFVSAMVSIVFTFVTK